MYFHLESRNTENFELSVPLATPIVNAYNFEIGLMRVEMLKNFDNAPFDRYIQFIREGEKSPVFALPRTHYATAAEINEFIRKLVNQANLKNYIEVTTMKGTETKWVLQPGIEIRFSEELKNWLGLARKSLNSMGKAEKVTVMSTPDVKRGFRRVYVKCDFVKPTQNYRGSLDRILDSFPTSKESEENSLSQEFSNPLYQPIHENIIENLKLQLCDEEGRLLTHNKEAIAWALVHIRPKA